MHIHILGICGTFMGSLAILARELGFKVTGSDQNVYPPMSTQLQAVGIDLMQGYAAEHLQPHPDIVVVGNALKRGMPAIEYMLNAGLRYTSGPQFLADYVLPNKHVLAVAGTHGKTTTTTMLAWVLHCEGLNPGFLIGGVPQGFTHSSRLGGDYFVVEADEYDSAFFDKRSKFVHYKPRTAILNNLEFDHADIFDDLAAIQKQFHHLVRTIPSEGVIVMPAATESLETVVDMGCWTPVQRIGESTSSDTPWRVELCQADGSHYRVYFQATAQAEVQMAEVQWQLTGKHNVHNGVAAIAAAQHVGVPLQQAADALSQFSGVKRRMELIGTVKGIEVYDDFAHHPTAIETTLEGARQRIGARKLWAIIEPRSNTMRMGVHQAHLAASTHPASEVIWYQPEGLDWNLTPVVQASSVPAHVMHSIDHIIDYVYQHAVAGDVIVIMSNGGFGGIHQKLVQALQG